MGSVIAFASHEGFDPETTQAMAAAFEAAWGQLKGSGHVAAAPWKADATRETLAKRIVETAERGERDPIRLCDDALAHLPQVARPASA